MDKTKVHIHVDRERMKDLVTVNEVIEMQEGSLKAIRNVLARFVVSDETGDWLPEPEGLELVGGMSIRQLEEAGKSFLQTAENTAVPPGSSRT